MSYLFCTLAVFSLLSLSCGPQDSPEPDMPDTPDVPVTPTPDPTPDPEPTPKYTYWKVDESKSQNDISMTKKEEGGVVEYNMLTTGVDPYFYFEKLTQANPADSCVLTFEYQATKSISLQFFFCTPGASEGKSIKRTVASSGSWRAANLPIAVESLDFGWGEAGHSMRFDLGSEPGVTFKIRKVRLRAATAAEKSVIQASLDERARKAQVAETIKSYLSTDYQSKVTAVEVTSDKIYISGEVKGEGLELVELTPWQDITDAAFENRQAVSSSFKLSQDRFAEHNGYIYDRIQSRWAIVRKLSDTQDKLVSAAHYADAIPCQFTAPEMKVKSKKGLGGFFGHDVQIKDLDDLHVTSVTVNVTPTSFFFRSDPGNSITHSYCGKTYYVRKSDIEALDNRLKTCQDKGIMVAAIILIQRSASDALVSRDVVHPDCDGGNYSMPNFTTEDGVQTYGAMLDFLASRYNPADGSNGSIHNWIMHNEVDAANEWTNMGTGQDEAVVTHTYEKSLRLCYNIARQYYPYARVLASFAHTWTKCDNSTGFTSKSMLEKIVRYSALEGDFEWGLAAHPYPQSLLEPRIWSKDTRATYSMDSDFVTFKNLEVLDKWVKMPENMYMGSVKRTLWLSENGTNAKSYSESDLADQAAGAAWALKKVYALDGIDAIQWHNWYDHPTEVAQGLRIGLRDSNLAVKPVWYVYQAAGTEKESEMFDPYLSLIGVRSWLEILNLEF